jgi:hypothetical protein
MKCVAPAATVLHIALFLAENSLTNKSYRHGEISVNRMHKKIARSQSYARLQAALLQRSEVVGGKGRGV